MFVIIIMKFTSIYFYILFVRHSSEYFSKSKSERYCNIFCGDEKPVMCRRLEQKCKPAATCLNAKSDLRITLEEKHLIVHMHNQLRNQMALGLYNDLIATDMLEIAWSDELEDMAMCWANTCQVKLDPCIRTLDNQEVGQNIVLLNQMQMSRGPIVALQIGLETWFEKRPKTHLRADEINSYTGYLTGTSVDFTQAIWAKTRFVGCGRVIIGVLAQETLLVCNYLRVGNIPGEKMYTTGEKPCSQCPEIDGHKGECDHTWTSLCRTSYFQRRSLYESVGVGKNKNNGSRNYNKASVFAAIFILLNTCSFY